MYAFVIALDPLNQRMYICTYIQCMYICGQLTCNEMSGISKSARQILLDKRYYCGL